MLTSDFDYHLPPDLIAQHPVPRGEARLLRLAAGAAPEHRRIADLPALLAAGDLLVVNDTRVLPARLFARRKRAGQLGARLELLLLECLGPVEWECLVKPAKKATPGAVVELLSGREPSGLEAEVVAAGEEGRRRLRFSSPLEPRLEELGHVPLPPYIKRPDALTHGDGADRELYQTIFARHPGAVAAPTAGLHFTPELAAELAAAGVRQAAVTLHVGLGTFKPVTAEEVAAHVMEAERFEVPAATAAAIQETRRRGGRVVAVGTTVVRALESGALGEGAGGEAAIGEVGAGRGKTRLFITPGFRFRVVDLLLTNFHLPRSTLLMLVAAFAGRERVLAAYHEAVEAGYRFYSYGDAMLVERGA